MFLAAGASMTLQQFFLFIKGTTKDPTHVAEAHQTGYQTLYYNYRP